jgi:glycerol-3-phosphate dehydrogenase
MRTKGTSDPGAVSREHAILESDAGLVSIVGGKLTTFRVMAQQVVDRVASRLHDLDGRPVPERADTHRTPLPGGEAQNLDVLIEATQGEGFSYQAAAHLVHTYGSESAAVVRLAQSDPSLAEPVLEGHCTIWAELVYGMRREMAVTLGDLLIRRSHLFYAAPEQALERAPAVAEVAIGEMDWDAARRDAELEVYRLDVQRSLAFREDIWAQD